MATCFTLKNLASKRHISIKKQLKQLLQFAL